MEDYVDLDRHFFPYRDEADAEQSAQESYLAGFSDRPQLATWEDLLTRPRVVLLGEPGSGKTYELEARARALARAGKPSFFLDLRRLVSESVQAILGEEGSQPFRSWLSGNEVGYFFLDAVDEAKLRFPKDFYQALDRFANDLGLSALARADVILSSRISEWHPYTDRFETRTRLPVPSSPHEPSVPADSGTAVLSSGHPVVVQLAPLDQDRVTTYAKHCGVADINAFIVALDRHNAWAFTRRPIDVRGLSDFWREKGRLGTLRELIEHELDRHLQERPDRPDILTSEHARQGAEWLAAASVLCRQTNIRVPDERRDDTTDALEPAECLPLDWKPEWVRALLQRGIFDGAAYGRIRFHHRRVTEYLAAQWLGRRMRDGRDLPSLIELLFTEVEGVWVLRPSLAPTTVWLLLGEESWRLELRTLVLQTAPGILLRHGDPKELPLTFKQDALRHLAKRYRDRERVWLDVDIETLSRVAESGLATTVSDILRDPDSPDGLRTEMLRLVRHGGLVDCVDVAMDIIANPGASATIKSYAAAAVRDTGTRHHKTRLAQIAAEMESVPSMLCAHICEAVYPDVVGASAVVALLRKVEEAPQFTADLPYYLRQHLKSLSGGYDTEVLLAGLTELGQSKPWITFNGEPKRFSARFHWVGKPMVQVLADLLAQSEVVGDGVAVAADALELLKFFHRHPEVHLRIPDDLGERLARHKQVRRRYIWNRVAERRQRGKTDEPWLHQLFDFDSPLSEHPCDLDWLIQDIAEAKIPEDGRTALHLALQYWSTTGRKWRVLYDIWRAIAGQSDLRHVLLRSPEVRPWRPLVAFWYRNVRHKLLYGWWWYRQRYALSRFFDRIRDKTWLLRHLPGLYSGKLTHQLARLALEAHAPEHAHDRWAATDWGGLAKKRGWVVAYAAKHGCKANWASFAPPLIHEEGSGQETDHCIVGLSGLEALWADQVLEFARLSEREAEVATCYAFRELNDFPTWFPSLVEQRPETVRRLALSAIDAEWQIPNDRKHVHEDLCRLSHHGEYVVPLIEDDLLRRIEESEPTHTHVLVQALDILAKRPSVGRDRLAAIALERMLYSEDDRPRHLIWLSLGIQTDAARTLDYLERVLPTIYDPDQLVVNLCTALEDRGYGGRGQGPLLPQPDYQRPQYLGRLIPLVYRHVRPEDDFVHVGTYSPTGRDAAQNFRNNLFTRLVAQDDPETLIQLRQLLEERGLAGEGDWIRHLIDQHIELAAERPPWTPKTLREFAADFEYAPRTSYELYRLSISRFEDIKRSVEAAEVSARYDLREGDNEARLRSWLRRQLVTRGKDRYSVPQEEEIDLEKRPDLQIEVPGLPPLPVEIKWADRWTVAELLERLENQLFGDYLRAYGNRYGIFLIGYHGEKDYWADPNTRKRLSLNELRSLLQERSDLLASERDDVDTVRVISINFTRPS